MTKDEMREGLMRGKRLTQEEWSTADEIRSVDELVAEGFARATPWAYSDGFQCERRFVTGCCFTPPLAALDIPRGET